VLVERRHSVRTGELSRKEICVEALSHSQTRFMRRGLFVELGSFS
jgi:hypothetical protein